MFLERVDVKGFRGISRLSVPFNNKTVLIGENAWGKTSLLRGLNALLGNGDVPYQFKEDDFHKDYDEYKRESKGNQDSPKYQNISFVLTFRERKLGSAIHIPHLARLKPCWVRGKDSYFRVYYFAGATINKQGTIFTTHGFLDRNGDLFKFDTLKQVQYLLTLNPVFRVRDRRQVVSVPNEENSADKVQPSKVSGFEQKILNIFNSTVTTDGEMIPPETLKESVESISALFQHYFSFMPPMMGRIAEKHRSVSDIVTRPISNESLWSLQKVIKSSTPKMIRLLMACIAGSMIQARGVRRINRMARPIVIFEDIESRLHPTVLFNVWNVMDLIPMQQIITTNSGDILSTVALGDIRRFTRVPTGTKCYSVEERRFSNDDLRKIAFHIRINRPMTFFARTWIFVEGETEIWILNEFASIMGISLPAEGIRLVEYAQCGASPLIKLAYQLGIYWHLMADGDEAGLKYVRQAEHSNSNNQITLLPSKDIEHFLYENGFENVYRSCSRIGAIRGESEHRIIDAAIKRLTKPGMALAVVDEARKRGRSCVPELFQKLFANVMARSVR